ncbi:hypothetical protein ACJIZ3_015121 [Penstemon smallii]|uniref:Uncharacterized protein n=1 Tax=Penstemon smallii TaxID=265156 RepID=A0ABD3RLU0_9LAMI
MKREGRQHGMVRTYPIMSAQLNPRPNPRNLNELSSPPTAGLFNKVSRKPTNHSKFTGKCGRAMCRDCHIHPACKSKDKVKGALKIKSSSDVVSNHKLISWRIVDAKSGFRVSEFSATGMLDYLTSADYMDHDYEVDCTNDTETIKVEELYDNEVSSRIVEIDEELYDNKVSSGIVEIEEVDECEANNYEVNDVDNEDQMSFCEVGFVWQPVDGDESWCLVEEM